MRHTLWSEPPTRQTRHLTPDAQGAQQCAQQCAQQYAKWTTPGVSTDGKAWVSTDGSQVADCSYSCFNSALKKFWEKVLDGHLA